MGKPKESLEEKRARIYEEILEESNKPRFGYFGYTAPLCIGENSAYKTTRRKPRSEEDPPDLGRNLMTNPSKKGTGVDALFSFPEPLCNGDLYVDPGRRLGRKKVKAVDPEAQFKPAGSVKVPPSAYEYVEHKNGMRDPIALHNKYKDYSYPRNFVTSPAKIGGGGVLTPGVLFSPFPEYLSEEYDAMRKTKVAGDSETFVFKVANWFLPRLLFIVLQFEEMKRNKERQGDQMPFRIGACNDTTRMFQKNIEMYHCEQPYGVPRVPEKRNINVAQHDGPFRPANPSKKGHASTMSPFPEHMPEQPIEAKRKPRDEGVTTIT
ncbi:hypothetical protein Pmar_PMAR003712 [Perkinsus marinus ATCC 50983]|uniref:Cilia-and flagella-associated protein 96 n=1 Tax=Perkinsus marinus (strain ATCC 50983 / TXsc) TaxID=423536 RepID=C5KI37_PERM5|nr:hypothetical protein Pmar_PMAR003712 [Perkinsus marinus ATCC 50983]EER16249.1 hypothetical protein Pmar_PMAR003712 [Perkinsus marinus ATCC 50983]|eukprot:XP_002784453.1 hypothetical protein Pmar_PMAR003712 [Perkinsus marinus ATCC 50983]